VSAFAATIDDAAQRLSAALGLELPAPNRSTGDAAKSIRATGPGIWQVAGAPPLVPDAPALRNALAGVATVVDLSHARAALQVSGRDAGAPWRSIADSTSICARFQRAARPTPGLEISASR
jgi:heterotetrameric sarcosine oxidase gamma subunit